MFFVQSAIVIRYQPVGVVVKDIAIGEGGFGFDSCAGQIELSPTTCHRCNASVLPMHTAAEVGPTGHHSLHALA